MDHGDVVAQPLPRQRDRGRAGEPLPAAPRRRRSPSTPLLGPRSPGARRASTTTGCVVRGEWQGVRFIARARARGDGAGVVLARARSRTSGTTPATRRSRLRAGRGARALRRDPHERVLREPVRRLTRRSRIPSAGCVLAVRQNLADGRPPSVGADRLARTAASASRPTRCSCTASRRAPARRPRRSRGRRCPARAGSTSTRWR